MDFMIKLKNCALRNETGGRSAALAYYFLFSVFPVIGVFNMVLKAYGGWAERVISFFPSVTSEIIEIYINYVTQYPEITTLSAVSFAFFYMPFRAVKYILWDMEKVYGTQKDMHFIRRNLQVMIYTLFFLLVLVFTFVVMVIGTDMMLIFTGELLARCIKYFMPCIAIFVLLIFIFRTGTKMTFKIIYKGALVASLLWHVGSIAFSFYVNTFDKYSIVYGSLGSLMAFLVWIYLGSFCVLMGTRVNCVLTDERKDLT